MIYRMLLRAKPIEAIPQSYDRFIHAIAKVEGGWGISAKDCPNVKDPGNLYVSIVKLKKLFPRIACAELIYNNRKVTSNDASSDDVLFFEFDSHKRAYSDLAEDAFAKYVDAFRAYRGEIQDVEFTSLEFDSARNVDQSRGVYRIAPVAFYSRDLCASAFQLTPEEVVQRCSSHVEQTRVICDGALIIASSKILSLREADEINCRLQLLLTGKKVAPLQGLPEEESEPTPSHPPEASMPKPKGKSRSSKKPSQAMLHLARATIISMLNLELADEDDVDPDTAVKFLESIAGELRQCDPEEMSALRAALADLEKEASKSGRADCADFYADFMQNLGFEDE